MKVLILGGYGVFGGRLVTLLSDCLDLELLVCGRSLNRAEAFCAGCRGEASFRPVGLDRHDIAEGLQIHRPDIVVDASGPFQAYGEDRYCVITACIDAGIDYLDFADAADFVFGVNRLDARAKGAGVFVLAGVSSFPVLTAAVLRQIAGTMDILIVEGGIAPSPYAGIGLNVMRAVVGYAGAPVRLWRNGRWGHGTGLAEGDDGPFIPSMAIEALIRRLLAGHRPDPGARPGTHALELGGYDGLFRGRTIFTGFRSDEPDAPLYRRLLGSAFDTLPPRVRERHDSTSVRQWSGVAAVRRGRSIPARAIAAMIGFPAAGTTFESETGGRFSFDVEISVPLAGLILACKGTLAADI